MIGKKARHPNSSPFNRTLIISALLLFGSAKAQSSAGAIFLLIPPSPTLNSMGELGVCLPSENPDAAYFNPGNGSIGLQGLSVAQSEFTSGWLPELAADMSFNHAILSVGLIPEKYPLQIVLHRQHTFLDAGIQTRTDSVGHVTGTFSTWFKSEDYTLAGLYHGRLAKIPLMIGVGFTRKTISQHLSSEISGQSKSTLYDFGALVASPIGKSLKNDLNATITPAIGYSISNLSDSIKFNPTGQADPAPRLVRAGFSVSANIKLKNDWKLVEFRGGRAASDLLIKAYPAPPGGWDYTSGLGDINVFKHLIQSKADTTVEIFRGLEITFLDFYSYRSGRRIEKEGRIDLYENGYGVNSRGIFRAVDYLIGARLFSIFNDYFNISYDYSQWETEEGAPLDNTSFHTYRLSLLNIDRLISLVARQTGYATPRPGQVGITLVAGSSYSRTYFSNSEIEKIAKATYGAGYHLGFEKAFSRFNAGLDLTELSTTYISRTDFADSFYVDYKVKNTFRYLSFYGFMPMHITKSFELLAGGQIAANLGGTLEISGGEPADNIWKDHGFNFGLTAGAEYDFSAWGGLRLSYQYWINPLNDQLLLSDNKYRLRGFKLDLIVKL